MYDCVDYLDIRLIPINCDYCFIISFNRNFYVLCLILKNVIEIFQNLKIFNSFKFEPLFFL